MKKILTYTFFLVCFSQAFSQSSFRLWDSTANVTNTVITVYVSSFASVKHEIKIENTTSASVSYKVERLFSTPLTCPNTYIAFCAAGVCLSPDTLISQSSPNGVILANQTLPSGAGTYGIEAHFDNLDSICCSKDVVYKVHNLNNPTDFATLTIRYICSGVGVSENKLNYALQLNAYPNPANSTISIKYITNENSKNGKLIMFDMLGKVVKELVLVDKKGVEKMSVENVVSGTYFISLVEDEKVIATKKIIIQSK